MQGQARQQASPVPIIFDSDMDGDCDDVAALALLHVLADRGEAEILATVTSSRSVFSPQCMSAINTYYGRGDLPVGVPKEAIARPSKYAQAVARLPHAVRSVQEAQDAVQVYRRALEAAKDGTVVIATVGFHTNLAAILREPWGPELVRRKVRLWACMGGNFIGKPARDDLALGNVNFQKDAAAAYFAIRNWPTRIVFVGREVASVPSGVKIGARFAQLDAGHPLRIAYEAYFGGVCRDRHIADPATVLFAVRGQADLWDMESDGYMDLQEDLTFQWRYDESRNQSYLLKKFDAQGVPNDKQVERVVEQLVMTPPRAGSQVGPLSPGE